MNRSLPALLAFLSLAAALGAQDKEPPEDPAIKTKVEQLDSARRDRKFARDGEAIQLIHELVQAQAAGLHKKDSRRILNALAAILTKGRLRKPPRLAIYAEASKALEPFGKDGAKALTRAHDGKRFPPREAEWTDTRTQLLRSIGATKDPRSVEYLIDVSLNASNSRERAASGEALGNFEHADQKVRKTIVKALTHELASLESESQRMVSSSPDGPQDFGPQNARERLDHVFMPWTGSLGKLTGKSFDTAEQWRIWFKKARRLDWDD